MDNRKAMELSETLIQQIRAKATGASVHKVCGLIGAYRMAVKLHRDEPGDPEWTEIADRSARKLYGFYCTGKAECLNE